MLQQFASDRGLGEVFFAPLPVRLWPGKFREPDTVYVRPERGEYAKARIPEYWIVDPEAKQLTVLVLEGAAYRQHGTFGPGDSATSAILRGLAISIAELFSSDSRERL